MTQSAQTTTKLPTPASSEPAAAPLDPRETAAAFLELPPDVQDLVRAGWRDSAAIDERVIRSVQEQRKLAILYASLLLVPVHLILQGLSIVNVISAIALGAGVGELWWRFRSGQLGTPLITAVAFFVFELPWFNTDPWHILNTLSATAFVAYASSYLGLRREMRITE